LTGSAGAITIAPDSVHDANADFHAVAGDRLMTGLSTSKITNRYAPDDGGRNTTGGSMFEP
jgi:hypothetical protein